MGWYGFGRCVNCITLGNPPENLLSSLPGDWSEVPVTEILYLAESVLYASHRGRGAGKAFFDAREAFAQEIGRRYVAFAAVVRAHDDPQKPAEYRDLAPWWRRLGYRPVPGALCSMMWKDHGREQAELHHLQVWIKKTMTALTVRQHKVAAATYPLNWFDDWQGYEDKITSWIEEAFSHGAKLAVFPHHGGQELASLCGDPQQAADPIASVDVITNLQRQVCGLHQHLADKFDMHILGASAAIRLTNGQVVNRAYFYSPMRPLQWQDKQVMTRWERDDWIVQRGDEIDMFDTALGKIAVLICYDCEFPDIGAPVG